MPGLNRDNNEPAYLLGRLWATLEQLDMEAHGRQGDGAYSDIIDRHHATTVVEPTLVIRRIGDYAPQLLKKLRAAGKPKTADRWSATIDDLVSRIGVQPPMNRSGDRTAHQSLFLVGYHHERAATDKLVSAWMIAEVYGYASDGAARVALNREDVQSRGRDQQTGAKLYSWHEVQVKLGGRPRKATD